MSCVNTWGLFLDVAQRQLLQEYIVFIRLHKNQIQEMKMIPPFEMKYMLNRDCSNTGEIHSYIYKVIQKRVYIDERRTVKCIHVEIEYLDNL